MRGPSVRAASVRAASVRAASAREASVRTVSVTRALTQVQAAFTELARMVIWRQLQEGLSAY